LYTKPKNLPWVDPKPRGTFNENDIEWIEEEDSRSGIPRILKMKGPKKSVIKEGKKTTILLYPRTYVNKKRSYKSRKTSLQPRLTCVKETVHDMLNMPMNELRPIWPLTIMSSRVSRIESHQT